MGVQRKNAKPQKPYAPLPKTNITSIIAKLSPFSSFSWTEMDIIIVFSTSYLHQKESWSGDPSGLSTMLSKVIFQLTSAAHKNFVGRNC